MMIMITTMTVFATTHKRMIAKILIKKKRKKTVMSTFTTRIYKRYEY